MVLWRRTVTAYHLVHWQNPVPQRECEYAGWLDALPTALEVFCEHARREPKELGLLRDDAASNFELTRPQIKTSNPVDAHAPLHLGFVMGNCVIGKEAEYDAWYDNVHSPEVLGTPDFVEMRRGTITPPIAWSCW
jgi:hypothetical protein